MIRHRSRPFVASLLAIVMIWLLWIWIFQEAPVTKSAVSTLQVPHDYATIQAAIDAAAPGDTIVVSPGTYYESLDLNKAVTLTAEFFDAGNPANNATIVDGGGAPAVISIPPGVSPVPTIRGLVIQNGTDGIRSNASFVVEYCFLRNAGDFIDYEAGSGGITRNNLFFGAGDDALDLDNQSQPLTIENNRLLYSYQDGIEIRLQNASAPLQPIEIIIRNNEIVGSGEDGIQFIDYNGDPQDTNRRFYIHNNLFANNEMAAIGLMPNELTIEDYSGADIVEALRVYNNTFYGNDYGISGGDNLVAFNNIVANSLIFGVSRVQGNPGDNSAIAATLFHNNGADATQSTLGTGNLFGQDPLFVAPPSPGPDGQFGTLDDDFSGLVLQAGSPAIDAGITQFTAADGELVPPTPIFAFNGSAPDMGHAESDVGPPAPTPTPTSTPPTTPTPDPSDIPVVDAVSTRKTSGASLTFAHTTGGANRLLVVGVSLNNDNLETVTAVTYDGLPLTFIGAQAQSDDSRVELWQLLAPPTGTHDVAITFSDHLLRHAVAGAISFTGVDQANPLGTFAGANGTSATAAVTAPAAASDLVLAVFACETCTSVAAAPSAVEQWNLETGTGSGIQFGAGLTQAGASPQVTFTASLGSGDHWAFGAIAIHPAATE